MTYDIKSFMAGLRAGLALPRVAKPKLKIVGWPTGTDAEIAAMVAALDSGEITVEDTGWQIGEERTVYLSAMEATGVGESHAAQTAKLVLMDSGHYTLATPTAAGRTTDHFVVGLKDCLNERGYINSTNTSRGSWNGCLRRAWCNDVFRMAIPDPLRSAFKPFYVIAASSDTGSAITTSVDYFALFAEKEICGTYSFSNPAEADALNQIEYYKTSANRIKKVNGSAFYWWERSPVYENSGMFCNVDGYGRHNYNVAGAATQRGLSPFGCI